ncbi:MAG: MFS transporter [Rhizobiaceae bacterium]|nr:MFS transporter [Rhizobiaceae bacterium]
MSFPAFLRDNARWLAGGFLLTYFSSFGQTFFISLSAADIRTEYGLSHGQFGTIYMVATLAAAFVLPALGALIDRHTIRRMAVIVIPVLALACVAMWLSTSLPLLVFVIFLMRLFGQGMMNQNAFTAAGRWFVARRGTAMAVTAIGLNAGEATLPFIFVLLIGEVGWRASWLVAAGALVFVALPLIAALLAVERIPGGRETSSAAGATRDWTAREVSRDPYFYVALAGVVTVSFVGTSVFFHQVHLVGSRGWSLEVFAASFTVMALTTVTCSLISGRLVDRFSAVRMMPAFILPLAIGCLILGFVAHLWAAFVFMALLGISYGFANTIFGALWPEVYGTAAIGAIRGRAVAIMVFATAAGPGLTGFLLDRGVTLPAQIVGMGFYGFFACGLMVVASRAFRARLDRGAAAR